MNTKATHLFRSVKSFFQITMMMLQGRETPSPGDTPYLCRQRNNSVVSGAGAASVAGRGELSEMERGALLAPPEQQCV